MRSPFHAGHATSALAALLLAVPAPIARGQAAGSGGPSAGAPPVVLVCADTVSDQSGAGCLQASSLPVPGLLFPPPHDGGVGNSALAGYAFVGGGVQNEATRYGSTVGGGSQNGATGLNSTVGGGSGNTASGSTSAVGGGRQNGASGYSAVVGGGFFNRAFGINSAVGGGYFNWAVANHSTVPGGDRNTASGTYSFAAGRRAKANHAGSFVWGDSQDVDKTSSAADEFNVYASGGTRIFSNATATSGVLLLPGAGMWTTISDREAKADLEPVDGREVLERVAELPIWTWSYRSQPGVRHLGPTAQDFHAAFGLGAGETTIDALDPAGVALAAIQGLAVELNGARQDTRELRERLERAEARLLPR